MKMRCKGYEITELKNGHFKIKLNDGYKTYQTVCNNFNEAGQWVFEMANNNDHGRYVNQMMCKKFNKTFF